MFAVVCWLAVFILAIVAGVEIFNSLLVGLALWALAMAFLTRPFLVSVPEIAGLVTINLFSGGGRRYCCYPTGIHFRFPWEQVKERNYIDLQIITDSRGESYPSKAPEAERGGGPMMLAKWSFQYRPLMERLDRYIAVDETTIKKGLIDVGSSFLSTKIASMGPDEAKASQPQIESDLRSQFEGMIPPPEDLYGIQILRVALADLDYEERYQRSLTSKQVAERLKEIAAGIRRGHPEISEKDALNAAMIINGDIKKSIQEIDWEGGETVAAIISAIFKSGRNT